MGMYDSFLHPCPDCKEDVEWQTKAGDCELRRYRIDDVPSAIAAALDGESVDCSRCGRTLTFATQVFTTVRPDRG